MHLIDKILPGFSWVALANVFRQVQQVVALVVYSYFLSPSDFGLFSIVLIFSLFAGLFSNFGTSSAVIYFNDKSKEFLSTIFIFNIIIGFIVFVILNTSSIYVADFFNKPELNSLIKYISINFIFQSLFLVHKALLEMDMSFKVISFIETISIFSATIMGIFFVYKYDVGVYGLVIQSVVNTFLLLILFWSSSKWRPILYFSFPQIKKVYAYAINLTLFNMLNYFTNNIDQFLIGKILSSASLGIYSIALRIVISPLVNVSSIIVRVIFPVLSHYKDEIKKVKLIYLQIIFNVSVVTFPLMVGLMSLSEIFVETIFNDEWAKLGYMLVIMAPIGLINSIVTTTGVIYTSNGNTRLMLKLSVVNLIVMFSFIYIGAQYGLDGVAYALLLATILLMFVHLYFAWNEIGLTLLEGFSKLFPVLMASIIMGVVTHSIYLLGIFDFGIDVINLLLIIFIGIIIYALMIKIYFGSIKSIFKLPSLEIN
jgi:O-antigen/teichoic acid export membrane protein